MLIPCISLADLRDLDIILKSLDSSLFPGVPSNVRAHKGFAGEQARYVTSSFSLIRMPHPDKIMCSLALTILSLVQYTLSAHNASNITTVGHSLGAAVALLDALYFRIQFNSSVNVRMVGYGMPRVGNRPFANWVDSHLGSQVTHINNLKDPIPILPPRFLDFHHPSGEVHITDSGTWESCPGELFSSFVVSVSDVQVRGTDLSARRVASQARTILPIRASSAMYGTSSRATLKIITGPMAAS